MLDVSQNAIQVIYVISSTQAQSRNLVTVLDNAAVLGFEDFSLEGKGEVSEQMGMPGCEWVLRVAKDAVDTVHLFRHVNSLRSLSTHHL